MHSSICHRVNFLDILYDCLEGIKGNYIINSWISISLSYLIWPCTMVYYGKPLLIIIIEYWYYHRYITPIPWWTMICSSFKWYNPLVFNRRYSPGHLAWLSSSMDSIPNEWTLMLNNVTLMFLVKYKNSINTWRILKISWVCDLIVCYRLKIWFN